MLQGSEALRIGIQIRTNDTVLTEQPDISSLKPWEEYFKCAKVWRFICVAFPHLLLDSWHAAAVPHGACLAWSPGAVRCKSSCHSRNGMQLRGACTVMVCQAAWRCL